MYIKYLNNSLIKIIVFPLLVSVLISFTSFLWKYDIEVKDRIIASKTVPLNENLVSLVLPKTFKVYLDDKTGDISLVPKEKYLEVTATNENRVLMRYIHGKVLEKLSEAQVSKVGYDIVFYPTIEDYGFKTAIEKVASKNITLIFATDGDTLESNHWLYELYKKREILLASTSGKILEKGKKIQSYGLKDSATVSENGVLAEMELPSIALAFTSELRDTTVGTYNKDKLLLQNVEHDFRTITYKEILDDSIFEKIKDSLKGSWILVGVEAENDIVSLHNKNYYGFYMHLLATNLFTTTTDKIEYVTGLYKMTSLFIGNIVIALLLLLLRKNKFLIKIFASFSLIVLFIIIFMQFGYVLPIVSFLISSTLFLLLSIYPDVLISRHIIRLNRVLEEYEFYNENEFTRRNRNLKLVCSSISELNTYILNLNNIFVEYEGNKTYMQLVDYRVFQKLNVLEDPFDKVNMLKADKFLKQANFLKESCVLSKIRRMRNYLAHTTLNSENATKYAKDAFSFYVGKDDIIHFRPEDIFRFQDLLLKDLIIFIEEFNKAYKEERKE